MRRNHTALFSPANTWKAIGRKQLGGAAGPDALVLGELTIGLARGIVGIPKIFQTAFIAGSFGFGGRPSYAEFVKRLRTAQEPAEAAARVSVGLDQIGRSAARLIDRPLRKLARALTSYPCLALLNPKSEKLR